MKIQRLSILMFSNTSIRAGVEEHILQLLNGLDRKQFQLHLACTPEVAQLLQPDLPDDVQVCRLTLDSLTNICGAVKLAHYLQGTRIHILHSHLFRASLFASPIARIMRIPIVVETAHIRELWRKGWKANFAVDRFAAQFVDRTIAVSNAIAQYLIQSKKLPAEKITVIPTAPALAVRSEPRGSICDQKHVLGIGDAAPLIVLVGRLEPQKGHRVAISAMVNVIREFPRAQLVCLGEGSLRSELEQLVLDKHLQQHIHFVGYQTNVRDWFATADLSILPSFYEGLPMTALESLAEGCPIVATAVDGTPEVVRHNETGILVPPGDVDLLADEICHMLRDRAFAKSTAEAGRKYVLDNFTVTTLVSRTQDVYMRAWEAYVVNSERRTAFQPLPS